ncbi:NnrS family protein [Niveibacterium sp. SC-1]|uniref:NnrS family protein n=1 Tax=Niveibacterium sp. SC-1 TaxID=3135646 RepID=UPI00311F9049
MALIQLQEARAPKAATGAARGFALFALGFRPLYLLGAAWAAAAVPLWLLQLWGVLPAGGLPALYWHAHEMIFGFAAAIIVGFLFTAGRNWTGLDTPKGLHLAAIAALWLVGRIALAFSGAPLAAAADLLFLPWAAFALGRVLIRAGSRRNYFTVVLLLTLTLCNLAFHLALRGTLGIDPMLPLHLALGLVVVLATVIAGRIVPSFTRNALGPVRQQLRPRLDRVAIALTLCSLLAWATALPALLCAALLFAAAGTQFVRALGWTPWPTRGTPLLWSLHLGHGWIPVGLALAGLAQLGLFPLSLAWHALALGSVGGLILAMITRTALGHSGRPLKVGRLETTAYVLLNLAVILRVFGPALHPSAIHTWLALSMSCWSTAFLLYLLKYTPYLVRPRADGKPG